MNARFSGKVVLVAGGTGGLGRAVSLAFLQEGAKVAVTYRKQDEFDALKQAARSNDSRLGGHVTDVTDEIAVSRLVDKILSEHGRLDALVNAVGGYAGGNKLWDSEARVLDQMLALNLRSGYALSRAAVPAMLKQNHGAIVNIAAKAAIALLDSLAADLKGSGVRVNSVLPSIIDTEANRKAMPESDFALWPKPEDIARVILFLCSDDARVIHGAAIPVYGDS